MMQVANFSWRGMTYEVREDSKGMFQFYIPYRNFTSNWYSDEDMMHKEARNLIYVYTS